VHCEDLAYTASMSRTRGAGHAVQRALPVIMLLAIGLLAGAPSRVDAAGINECGKLNTDGYSVFNITSRVASCGTARRMARAYYKGRWTNTPNRAGRPFRRGRYTCRYRLQGYEGVDMRCTAAGGRVVRFQASS